MMRWLLAWLAAAALLSGCGGGGSAASGSAGTSPAEPAVTGPGELKQAVAVNTLALADISAAVPSLGSPLPPGSVPRYAVTSYRLSYLTQDGQGQPVEASGLISVPLTPGATPSPVISYQHGTIFHDADAPSNKVLPSEPTVVLASLGYIVVAPDFVGFGVSRGRPHPYLLSAPTAAAVVDLLTAARTWRKRNGVADNGQLFLVGYSEGGYATMAAHRALQASASPHLVQLVGSVPGAGPYHVGVTLDALLERVRDENSLIGALISPGLLRFLGADLRDEVRRLIMRALVPDDTDVVYQTTFLDHYLADDDAAIERDCNVHDWAPAQPVRMFHGRDDETVTYAASQRTLETMRARGAPSVSLSDCTAAPSGHLGCIGPYFAFALGQFAALPAVGGPLQ